MKSLQDFANPTLAPAIEALCLNPKLGLTSGIRQQFGRYETRFISSVERAAQVYNVDVMELYEELHRLQSKNAVIAGQLHKMIDRFDIDQAPMNANCAKVLSAIESMRIKAITRDALASQVGMSRNELDEILRKLRKRGGKTALTVQTYLSKASQVESIHPVAAGDTKNSRLAELESQMAALTQEIADLKSVSS